jgi:hypothetical protein
LCEGGGDLFARQKAHLAGPFIHEIVEPEKHFPWQREWRGKEIDPAKAARGDVGIVEAVIVLVSAGQDEGDDGGDELSKCCKSVGEGQMEQAITAEPEIGHGKGGRGDVGMDEADIGAAVGALVLGDQRADDIATAIVDAVGCNDKPHPNEIATGRIEYRSDPKGFDDFEETGTDLGSLFDRRAITAHGFLAATAPVAGLKDPAEALFGSLSGADVADQFVA